MLFHQTASAVVVGQVQSPRGALPIVYLFCSAARLARSDNLLFAHYSLIRNVEPPNTVFPFRNSRNMRVARICAY